MTSTAKALEQLRSQVGIVKSARDTKDAKALKDALYALDYQMLKDNTGFWAGYIASFDNHFDSCEWLDRSAARRLIDEGKENLATAPSLSRLKEIVFSLFKLLPEKTESIGDTDLKILRH